MKIFRITPGRAHARRATAREAREIRKATRG